MAVGPVFTSSRFLGVLPFDSYGKFDRTAYLFSSAFFIGLSGFVLYAKFYRQRNFDFVSLLSMAQYAAQILSVSAHLYMTRVHRKRMQRILQAVSHVKGPEYDLKLLTIGTLLCLGAAYRSVLSKGFITTAGLSGFGVIMFTYLNFLIVAQFCTILSRLNWSIEQLLIQIRLYKVDVGEHFNYLSLARITNDAYSYQLLVIFIQMFSYLVTYPYFAWRQGQTDPAHYYFTSHFIYLMLHIIIRFIMLFSITSTCHKAASSVESFNVELFRLMRDSKHLCENENLYLYATMKNGVTFTACGFFNLGYPLVTSIIAAAATYLVILIQFSSSSED